MDLNNAANMFVGMPRDLEIRFLSPSLEFKTLKLEVVFLPTNMLAKAVKQPLNEKLLESMKEIGMKNPIITVPNSKKNYNEAVIGLSNKEKFDASKKWLVVYGNQRLECLEHLDISVVPVLLAAKPIEAIAADGVLNGESFLPN